MTTYSPYTCECGQLRILGRKSKRSMHDSMQKAIDEIFEYRSRMERIASKQKVATQPKKQQYIILEYSDTYESHICAVLSDEDILTLKY